jgi:hypothetical protein
MKIITNILFILMLLGGSGGVVYSTPTDNGWRFNYSNIYIRNITTTDFSSAFNGAASDFANAGNFSFVWGPSNLNPPFNGHVAYEERWFGAVPWMALAIPFNASGQEGE